MSRPRRSMAVRAAVALFAMSVAPGRVHAQDVSELVASGRFEEAAALLNGRAGGDLRFNEAYRNELQTQDFEYAVRSISAAKQTPDVSEQRRQVLDFWHGFSVFQLAMPLAAPQDLAAAQRTLPMFQEALALIRASGEYPRSINLNIDVLFQGLGTYIDIQEAIIRRGY